MLHQTPEGMGISAFGIQISKICIQMCKRDLLEVGVPARLPCFGAPQ